MAVGGGYEPITEFEQWYASYDLDPRDGSLQHFATANCADVLRRRYDAAKREMDRRVANYWKLEKLADGEVINEKPDLPNVSSGETAGLVRRTARNLVQNCPNVEVISKFDDDGIFGIFSRHILTSKIIGSDEYSNDMQQNLFASTKMALTLGFDCVIPLLLQDAGGSWFIKYDSIHYRDVFPDPGVKDIRQAPEVFVRRYLTQGEAWQLIRQNQMGWDMAALKQLVKNRPPVREEQSVNHQQKKHHQIPDGYELITWYSSTGDAFLTWSATTGALVRIEKNKHPMKEHPVHFLVLEKDSQQPLGKSQVELMIGRQDFQDLMLNGAMKLWYRNINPSIIGYGTVNTIPNLSPGKFTQISNPNAKVEPFEINTQTLMQYGTISQQNLGSMVQLMGAADQQMAMQGGGNGQGMSATPQGVEAQTAMVDITTNNYQKAIESFFSHYCSYALTMYFQELRAVKSVKPTAEARIRLIKAGLKPYDPETKKGDFTEDWKLDVDFEELATEYWVRCIPGSLTELEDEKQLRLLNGLFVPLSQAMPALAAAQDPGMIRSASLAMDYIIRRQIELSGATDSQDIVALLKGTDPGLIDAKDERVEDLELMVGGLSEQHEQELDLTAAAIKQLQEGQAAIVQNMGLLLEKLGVVNAPSETVPPEMGATQGAPSAPALSVAPASA